MKQKLVLLLLTLVLLALPGCQKTVPDEAQPDENPPSPSTRLQPRDLVYLGAFRLPEGSNGCDWSWSGEALAYFPGGDPAGSDDGCPGSLLGTGHNWLQWLSEISIPAPRLSTGKQLAELPTASTLQPFADIRAALFDWPLEIPARGPGLPSRPTRAERGHALFRLGAAHGRGANRSQPRLGRPRPGSA